ncbi:putative ankyrin repeat protein [Cotonvirus japonicus]|uniref:Ankyrin repeat protein n=1 Tax=Cotonvirus japonicus TaxID=2811091 RepID=A0ABM7NR94_9VIRU|nr:putative ankyrin repeat protein [Cotonvirus japonicus]BCS82679.1 putative ankyrin repeat protein [Cotonvirus japonicus]
MNKHNHCRKFNNKIPTYHKLDKFVKYDKIKGNNKLSSRQKYNIIPPYHYYYYSYNNNSQKETNKILIQNQVIMKKFTHNNNFEIEFYKTYKNLNKNKKSQIKFKNFLHNNVNVHQKDRYNMTHLMCVCMYSQNDSNLMLVEFLIWCNVEINCGDNALQTALMYALNFPGNIKIIELLIKNGSRCDHKNFKGENIILLWSKTRYLPCIKIGKILLEAGANINDITYEKKTILDFIVKNRHNVNNVLKFVLQNGFDFSNTNQPNTNSFSRPNDLLFGGLYFPRFSNFDCNINQYSFTKRIFNKYYSNQNNISIISLLLDYGYNYNDNNYFKHTLNKKNDKIILKIINTIEYSKTYFKTIQEEINEIYYQLVYRPGGLRSKIIRIDWLLYQNIGNIYETINDSKLYDYLGVFDEESLIEKISEFINFMD